MSRRLFVAFWLVVVSLIVFGLNQWNMKLRDEIVLFVNILLAIIIPVAIIKTIKYPASRLEQL